jgi:uncharacterized membrane protein
MNIGTKLRTILAIATALNTANVMSAFAEFDNPIISTIYKAVSLIALIIVMSANTYYNNDYSEIACEHTGAMRLAKEQKKGNIHGENFIEEDKGVDGE